MANSFALAQTYLPLLDEVYKASSKTSILDATNVEIVNGNTIKMFKTEMDGLGNYGRNSGFADGQVVGTWETMTLAVDRGRSFVVDAMDDEETLGMAFGTLAGEFIRTKVAPEVDAYTFAKLAGTANISAATPADIVVGTTDVPGLINEAERQMNEDEVPEEGRILFISESCYAGLRDKITRQVNNTETGIQHTVETYDSMPVIRVPQNRFYTAITQNAGASMGAGGYAAGSNAKKINFMVVHPSAIAKCVKHVKPRIFSPDVFQKADAWSFQYRVYWDVFTRENKLKGIYLHKGVAAL